MAGDGDATARRCATARGPRSSGDRRRRSLARIRPRCGGRHAQDRGRCGGTGDGDERRPGAAFAADDAGGATTRERRPRGVLGGADQEHARPGHGHDAEVALRNGWTSSASTLPSFSPPWDSDYPGSTTPKRAIAACRAFNVYQAELFEPLKDRITPPAVIPMHHPEEAIAELEHAVGELGLKAVMLNSMIDRPIPHSRRRTARRRRPRSLVRRVRSRQRLRLRPGLGEVPRTRCFAHVSPRFPGPCVPHVAVEFLLQTISATSRRPRKRSARQSS